MKITNRTNWRTLDLRRIFTRVIRQSRKTEGHLPWEAWESYDLKVTVTTARQNRGCSGWAIRGGSRMRISIPKVAVDPVELAWLFSHELQHIRGYRHCEMSNHEMRRTETAMAEWAWAKEFPICKKESKSRPVVDLRAKRYEHALGMRDKKLKALKRLEGQVRRWSKKVKYYERVLAAAGKLSPAKE